MRLPNPVQLARLSLTRPKLAASFVLATPVRAGQAAAIALLAIILGTLMASLGAAIRPIPDPAAAAVLLNQPIRAVIAQYGLLLAMAGLVAAVGRAIGGRGDFGGAVKVLAWLQVMLAGFQAVQLAVLILVPPLSGFVAVASFIWFLWALSSFTAALHGFESVAKTGGLIFISLFAVLFIGAVLLTALGVGLPELN